jgi:hypothetical protein
MAALVGFLFVGQATDWKILFSRKAKANSSLKFGAPEMTRAGAQHSRQVRAGASREAAVRDSTNADPKSEIADRRPAPSEVHKSESELD